MSISTLHQQLIDSINDQYPGVEFRVNTKPEWLVSDKDERMELDVYIPSVSLAIEIQGGQHYEFTNFFHHGDKAYFKKQLLRDVQKRQLCQRHDIELIEVRSEKDFDLVLRRIKTRGSNSKIRTWAKNKKLGEFAYLPFRHKKEIRLAVITLRTMKGKFYRQTIEELIRVREAVMRNCQKAQIEMSVIEGLAGGNMHLPTVPELYQNKANYESEHSLDDGLECH